MTPPRIFANNNLKPTPALRIFTVENYFYAFISYTICSLCCNHTSYTNMHSEEENNIVITHRSEKKNQMLFKT